MTRTVKELSDHFELAAKRYEEAFGVPLSREFYLSAVKEKFEARSKLLVRDFIERLTDRECALTISALEVKNAPDEKQVQGVLAGRDEPRPLQVSSESGASSRRPERLNVEGQKLPGGIPLGKKSVRPGYHNRQD